MTADHATPRVKVVQAQARRALRLSVVFAVGATLTTIVPHATCAWLPLHLFLVGSLLLAISGATRLFTVTWSAGQPRGDRVVATQRWLVVVGAAGLAIAREVDLPVGVTATFGVAVTCGLALLGWLLVVEARSARVRRFQPAVLYYLTAITFGVAGTILGAAMVLGGAGIRDAHVIVNVCGLIGLVIAGTLPTFVATQARMKMSRRATPNRLYAALTVLGATVAFAATAAAITRPGGVAVGLGAYAAALIYVVTTLPRPGRKQIAWAGPRLAQLALGMLWWIGTIVVASCRAARGSDPMPETVVVTLVVGGYLQILVGSLAYLGPVLRGGGHVRLTGGFALTRSWISTVAANVAALGWIVGADAVTVIGLVVVAVDVGVRAALLARSAPALA